MVNRLTGMLVVLVVACCGWAAIAGEAAKAWTDPEAAAKDDPDFALQGEYAKAGEGLQVAAMGKGKFLTATLKGGLPDAGWDGKSVTTATADSEAVKKLIAAGWAKTERKIPNMGAKPPQGAVVLFDGSNANEWDKAKITSDKLLQEGPQTVRKFKNFIMHVEFMLPYKPAATLSGQDRGNSGVYIFNRYEVQILDTFGLHFYPNTHGEASWAAAFQKELGYKQGSDRTQFCASMYHFRSPALNAATPPLTWQTYDITFLAPKFEDGKKTANARITLLWNGIKVHDGLDLPKGTGAGGNKPEVPSEAILLQGHGNPVRFRNIWIVEQP